MTYLYVIWITLGLLTFAVSLGRSDNLTCYQCTKHVNEECSQAEYHPCPPEKDRCVTLISKDDKNGFSIKRECGLGPCGFNDVMMNKGLGLDGCDRSKDQYFCLFCCRTSGCNKSKASLSVSSVSTILLATILIICSCFNLL